MAANPISDEALEAYCRRTLIHLSAWEKEVIFRVDDAVLAVWAEQARRESGLPSGPVPISDVKGIRALFANKAVVRPG